MDINQTQSDMTDRAAALIADVAYALYQSRVARSEGFNGNANLHLLTAFLKASKALGLLRSAVKLIEPSATFDTMKWKV